MSKEMLITKGNYYYLIDVVQDKGYSFSTFGEGIKEVNARYAISLGGNAVDVDILSILSDTTTVESEVYLRGEKILVGNTGMNIYSKLSKALPKATFIPFRIKRENMLGLMQILVPLKKGECSFADVKSALGV